uniref:Predicted protein n=1 Tax=Hordeum vulgare subsp. vulgare TaxID=112509 RepID=F2CXL8_HORVV|nr:predicted protein [Hordeum vulgare subsp. vulgare]BAJ87711.1 predicted protein [Hordeum vulgare subsp. vulgare]
MVPARPLLSLPSRSTSTSSRLVLHHDQAAPSAHALPPTISIARTPAASGPAVGTSSPGSSSPCHGAQARGSRSFVGRLQHRERDPSPAPASNVCSTSSPAPEPPLEQFCSPLSSSPQARPRRRCPAPETNLSSGRACEQLLEPPRRPVSRRGPGRASPLALSSPPSILPLLSLISAGLSQELTRGLPYTSPPRIDLAPRSSLLGQEHLVVLDLAAVGDQH